MSTTEHGSLRTAARPHVLSCPMTQHFPSRFVFVHYLNPGKLINNNKEKSQKNNELNTPKHYSETCMWNMKKPSAEFLVTSAFLSIRIEFSVISFSINRKQQRKKALIPSMCSLRKVVVFFFKQPSLLKKSHCGHLNRLSHFGNTD